MKEYVYPSSSDSLTDSYRHLKFNALRWLVYHGKDREKLWNSIPHCNVVFTTYETVVKDYQKHKSSHHPTPILTLTWRRIVLDEGTYFWPPEQTR